MPKLKDNAKKEGSDFSDRERSYRMAQIKIPIFQRGVDGIRPFKLLHKSYNAGRGVVGKGLIFRGCIFLWYNALLIALALCELVEGTRASDAQQSP